MSNKLGTKVTYHDLDGSAPVVSIDGVEFHDGDTIDLADYLNPVKAAAIAAKLAGNHFFDVDGSKADHSDVRERIAEESGAERRRKKPREGTVSKAVRRKLNKEDAENGDDPKLADEQPPEIPDDIETPDQPTLENARPARQGRPRLPRGE